MIPARQAFLQHRAGERVVTAEDGIVVPDEGEDRRLRQGPTRPLNVVGVPRQEVMVPSRCVLERRRCDQDAYFAHRRAPNLAAPLPQRFMLKVHDLFCQGGEHAPGGLMLAYGVHIAIKGVEEHVLGAQALQGL